MKYQKMAAVLCSFALMAGVVITGCGVNESNTADSTNVSQDAGSSANNEETTVFGQISSIDGNTITVALAEQPQMPGNMPEGSTEIPQMPEGSTEMPQMPEGSTEMPMGGNGGEPPSGDFTDGERPQMPDGNQGGGFMGGLSLTGEEQTVEVEEETVITIRNGRETSEGTIADLTQEDIVTIVMNGDKAVSITVGGMGAGRMGDGGMKGSDAIDGTEEA